MWHDNIEHVDPRSAYIEPFTVGDVNFEHNFTYGGDPDNGYWFNREEEYTFHGIPNYFKSNAMCYFCWGERGDETAFYSSGFQQKQLLGFVCVGDESKNIVDLHSVNQQEDREPNKTCHDSQKTFITEKYRDMIPVRIYQQGAEYLGESIDYEGEPLDEAKCRVDGFQIKTSGGRRKFGKSGAEDQYGLEGKRVYFVRDDFLVRVAESANIWLNYHLMLLSKMNGDGDDQLQISAEQFDNGATVKISGKGCLKYGDPEKSGVRLYRKSTLMKTNLECESFPPHGWTGYFCLDVENPPNMLIGNKGKGNWSGIPMFKNGLNLVPVFRRPACTYLGLLGWDYNGALKTAEQRAADISINLKRRYKDAELIRNTVSSWENTSIQKELKKLKESPSKFKILNIMAHGGQYRNSERYPDMAGMSYSMFVDPRNAQLMERGDDFVINYNHLKYLLKDMKPDEYYLIFSNSCHGGGLVECPYTHTNFMDPDYADVKENPDLGNNYTFYYLDCANSPAWSTEDNFIWENIYLKNYSENCSQTNELLNTIRGQNISSLVNLMEENLDVIKSLISPEYAKFTFDSEFNSSIFTGNLIIKASSVAGTRWWIHTDELREMAFTYPIVFLLYMVFGTLYETLYWNNEPKGVWFSSIEQHKMWTFREFVQNPNGFCAAAIAFNRKNRRFLQDWARFALPDLPTTQNGNDPVSSSELIKYARHIKNACKNASPTFKNRYVRMIRFFYNCYETWFRIAERSKPLASDKTKLG